MEDVRLQVRTVAWHEAWEKCERGQNGRRSSRLLFLTTSRDPDLAGREGVRKRKGFVNFGQLFDREKVKQGHGFCDKTLCKIHIQFLSGREAKRSERW